MNALQPLRLSVIAALLGFPVLLFWLSACQGPEPDPYAGLETDYAGYSPQPEVPTSSLVPPPEAPPPAPVASTPNPPFEPVVPPPSPPATAPRPDPGLVVTPPTSTAPAVAQADPGRPVLPSGEAGVDPTLVTRSGPMEVEPPIVPSSSRTHRVVKGDTLWNISQRHGTTVAQLKATNGLPSDLIRIGQVLRLP